MMEDYMEKKTDDYTTTPEPSSPTSPTVASLNDEDHLQRIATKQDHDIDGQFDKASLAKTKSIAETLSLPHEIAFVSIVCMAQFMTRTLLSLAILRGHS
jgi:hypothetical protein